MKKSMLVAGSFFGLTAVILGAFGAHLLSENLSNEALQTFETGVKYQMYHALLLLLIGSFGNLSGKTGKILFWLLVVGVVLFSGSIYFLATNAMTVFDFTKIALLTPLGGLMLILGWVVLVFHFLKSKS